jgi:outer membrane protein assembly factor BamB
MQVRPRLASAALAAAATLTIAGTASAASPNAIKLPKGFDPESLTGVGNTLYSGSSYNGAIWMGNARTGKGKVIVKGQKGRSAFGTAVSGNMIVAAGGMTGKLFVYDKATGKTVRTFDLGGQILNDVVIKDGTAWVTDTLEPVIYEVKLDGSADPRKIELKDYPTSGKDPGMDGIALDGDSLIVGDITTGQLIRVDPTTGQSTPIDIGGTKLTGNDGILYEGGQMWVARGDGHLTVIKLAPGSNTGTVESNKMVAKASVDVAVAGGKTWFMDAAFATKHDPKSQAVIRAN